MYQLKPNNVTFVSKSLFPYIPDPDSKRNFVQFTIGRTEWFTMSFDSNDWYFNKPDHFSFRGPITAKANEWLNISFNQIRDEVNGYNFTIWLDGKLYLSRINPRPIDVYGVMVYVSSPSEIPLDGYVRSFSFFTIDTPG